MRNADLEREILAAPDDPAGYLVYADWLQTRGDPRGELIVRQHQQRDADAFLAQHRELFLGSYAESTPATFELTWFCGFIRTATIGWDMFGGEVEGNTSEQQLAAFLRLDSARFLAELTLGPSPDDDEMSLAGYAEVIERVAPPLLTKLYLGDIADWDISSTSTRMPASKGIQAMRDLTLRGGSVKIGAVDLPNLVRFTVESGTLTSKELVAIANARWPNLEHLEIWFGDPSYGATGSVADVQPILDARGLPKLRSLGLENCAFADELAIALIDSALLPQLRSLDLSMGNLSDRAIAAMLDKKERFASLEHLNLDDSALTNVHWPAANELAKHVVFGNTHDTERVLDPTNRTRYGYVSVGE